MAKDVSRLINELLNLESDVSLKQFYNNINESHVIRFKNQVKKKIFNLESSLTLKIPFENKPVIKFCPDVKLCNIALL